MKPDNDDGLKSLSKVVRVMECFAIDNRPLTLAEMCELTGLPKSTTHRIVSSMREVGFLDQDYQRDRYRLGLRLFEFGNAVITHMDLHREVEPAAAALRQISGQTVQVAVFDGLRAAVVHRAGPALRAVSEVASIELLPLHCTSLGKALLASQPAETIERVIALGLPRHTDNTLVDPQRLRDELAEVRRRGHAVDEGEHQPQWRCVAAPIHHRGGRVFAAIGISGPAWRLQLGDLERLSQAVMQQAQAVSDKYKFKA